MLFFGIELPESYDTYHSFWRVSRLSIPFDKEKYNMWIHVYKNNKGSLTVEAALAVPVFFFVVLAFLYLLQWQQVYEQIEYGLVETARESSQFAYMADEDTNTTGSSLYLQVLFGQYCQLDNVSLSDSTYLDVDDEIKVVAGYDFVLPIPILPIKPISMKQQIVTRGFTGRSMSGEDDDNRTGDIVYVTETGKVYHTNRMCTHLQLKIQSVNMASVENMRNNSGGTYKACERCVEQRVDGGVSVYVADYGDRYHMRRNCSGLKRTIYEKTLEQVKGMPKCKKCK